MRHPSDSLIEEAQRCQSDDHYWAWLRKQLPAHRFWTRWNLAYTKRVLAVAPRSAMAFALLRCWRPRIQRALYKRFGVAE